MKDYILEGIEVEYKLSYFFGIQGDEKLEDKHGYAASLLKSIGRKINLVDSDYDTIEEKARYLAILGNKDFLKKNGLELDTTGCDKYVFKIVSNRFPTKEEHEKQQKIIKRLPAIYVNVRFSPKKVTKVFWVKRNN